MSNYEGLMYTFPERLSDFNTRRCGVNLRTCKPSIRLITRNLLILCLYFLPVKAWCYRPFDSTDADVVEQGEIEIELGYFNWTHSTDENIYITPQVVFNYGITDEIEFVTEFDVEHTNGDSNITNPGIFIKKLLRKGILQDNEGPSLAFEGGLLLPSSLEDEDKVGFEAIGIISGEITPFVYHVNIGGGFDRVDRGTFGLWGVIVEIPVNTNTRLVGELNGEYPEDEPSEYSGLAGVIWEPSFYPDMALDLSIRRGIGKTEPDWSLSLGMTFNF